MPNLETIIRLRRMEICELASFRTDAKPLIAEAAKTTPLG